MSFARRLVALLLLALWLPATLHCALETAGFDTLFRCADEHQSGAHDEADRDSCDLVEGAAFKPAADTATLPRPAPGFFLLCLVVPTTIDLSQPATGVSEIVAAPPEVARTWCFVTRAAPPPRAPSLAS